MWRNWRVISKTWVLIMLPLKKTWKAPKWKKQWRSVLHCTSHILVILLHYTDLTYLYPVPSYISPCCKAYKALTFSFHPLWLLLEPWQSPMTATQLHTFFLSSSVWFWVDLVFSSSLAPIQILPFQIWVSGFIFYFYFFFCFLSGNQAT